jgi:hypothetical protein
MLPAFPVPRNCLSSSHVIEINNEMAFQRGVVTTEVT